ncbi:MAG: sugar-binding protein [Steroidobacteraceae bacterium]
MKNVKRSQLGIALFLVIVGLGHMAAAAEPPPALTKAVTISRPAAAKPVIDGHFSPEEWAGATLIEDLHLTQPTEFAKPSQRTQIYLLYDTDALYVAARNWDTNPVTARILRQGEFLLGDDHFGLIIDPLNNRRSGYLFVVNANGVRVDAIYQNVTQQEFNWDGIFEGAGSQDSEGWTAEMAIPYKTIAFNKDNDTWGINFFRVIASTNERIGWVSRNRSQDPSIAGTVSGFAGLDNGIGLDVVPSVSVRQARTFNPADRKTEVRPSMDVFYKVTPSLNAALTFNTDFSSTEVDDRQVNLTRFNLFFPEKRDFFLKDLDVFEFGNIGSGNFGQPGPAAPTTAARQNGRPFFSRNIGLSPTGVPVDLDYGGKVSGRMGRFSVGALGIRQDEFGSINASNLFVGRASANVLAESNVGVIATHGDPRSNLDNSLIGADFVYQNSRLASGLNLQAEGWVQRSETTGVDGGQGAYGFGVRVPRNTGLQGYAGFKEIGENFNPALGFVSERGIQDYSAGVAHHWRPRTGPFQFLFTGLDARRAEVLDGGLRSQSTVWRALHFNTRPNDSYRFNVYRSREVLTTPFQISRGIFVPVGDYSFDEYSGEFASSTSRPLSGSVLYRAGDFYTGERVNLVGKLTWRPSKHFRTSLSYDYNDVELPQGDFIVRLTSVRADVVFSSKLSWVNLIQYDNVSGVIGINSRLHYVPEDGREAFLVLNHNLQDPATPGGFQSTYAEVTAKVNYTFRF